MRPSAEHAGRDPQQPWANSPQAEVQHTAWQTPGDYAAAADTAAAVACVTNRAADVLSLPSGPHLPPVLCSNWSGAQYKTSHPGSLGHSGGWRGSRACLSAVLCVQVVTGAHLTSVITSDPTLPRKRSPGTAAPRVPQPHT